MIPEKIRVKKTQREDCIIIIYYYYYYYYYVGPMRLDVEAFGGST